jgi:hypothetical protein
LRIVVPHPTTPDTFDLLIKVNGVTAATVPFTAATSVGLTQTVSIAVNSGDVLTCFIQPTGLSDVAVVWDSILVESGVAVYWAFDTDLPAGTYCAFKVL